MNKEYITEDLISEFSTDIRYKETGSEDYPEYACKSVNLNFWSLVFPLLFSIFFSAVPLYIMYLLLTDNVITTDENPFKEKMMIFFFVSIFLVIGLLIFYSAIKNVYLYFVIDKKGTCITGKVCDYRNTNTYYNGSEGQMCLILINTTQGPAYITYDLKGPYQPFDLGVPVTILIYKKYLYLDTKQYDL